MRKILLLLAMALMVPSGAVAAGSYKVLYTFKGGKNAGHPFDALIFDGNGNLYGTTLEGGGTCGGNPCGTVFKLAPNSNGGWTESVLYRFKGGRDGMQPYGSLIFDQAGNLYGTTALGGNASCYHGCGTVFKLAPNSNGSWTESVLHSFCSFAKCADGAVPYSGLIVDSSGNLYGTTFGGGAHDVGVVFKLKANSNGSWAESVLYNFGSVGGGEPFAGLTFDAGGNLYGTTQGGYGLVFKLTPNSNGTWTEHVIHTFTGGKDGAVPWAGLSFDGAANIYGTTSQGGAGNGGTVFKLTRNSKGKWTESVLYQFGAGALPYAGVTLDASGNLYGATYRGGSAKEGAIFELTPQKGASWGYTALYTFTGDPVRRPFGGVTFDKAGNLYGTASDCNKVCRGVVFEITP
jgi:uncharacterized repeat protein (TIGR03803 family)